MLAIVAGIGLVWWAVSRETLPRTIGGGRTSSTSGSILDSANAGASKIKALFTTIFGTKADTEEGD
ncbi:MAG TPA: hypothetical protein VJV75_03785 [Candidatus Polarisedimenticolia bacterium]|nr:hypothetical protein [Candidatus Polarisedimenticolia bacterium]